MMCPKCNGDIRPWGVCQCGEKQLKARIAELEAVAEAAEATYKIFFWDGTKPLSHWEREYNALRAAGYLGDRT